MQRVLKKVMFRVLMDGDVPGAVAFAEDEVRRRAQVTASLSAFMGTPCGPSTRGRSVCASGGEGAPEAASPAFFYVCRACARLRQIRRLLSGRCEVGELVMTGGLWRVTGQQIAAAAAAGAGAGAAGAQVSQRAQACLLLTLCPSAG